ncbi:hypothetical protein M422DRAFT_258035 [Sphaerobolus stellatus SS14]|uniref:Unplaced genomic scaffold SPHSTscaffold_79, whole genome shotgun sequence n=1 Tax=Sphaerobolus stellatus (strain SS14) TaxID=990650 RepID=A0A0C9VC61_SPHS4|nr:hypothetical protein M422DRAFT_258035 [Sphaerobolus stellatus SS14]
MTPNTRYGIVSKYGGAELLEATDVTVLYDVEAPAADAGLILTNGIPRAVHPTPLQLHTISASVIPIIGTSTHLSRSSSSSTLYSMRIQRCASAVYLEE